MIIAGFLFIILNMAGVIIIGSNIGALGNFLFGDHEYIATTGWFALGIFLYIPLFLLECYLLAHL